VPKETLFKTGHIPSSISLPVTEVESKACGLFPDVLACDLLRGASCLVLDFSDKRPIHAVCALKRDPDEILIITVYDPSN
jgi:hypothetical protein